MKIVVGSLALQYSLPSLDIKPKDVDIWTDEEIVKNKGLDIKFMPRHILELIPNVKGHAVPDALYTIKCSHLAWDNPMWEKHKLDIVFLSTFCNLIPELYTELVTFWKEKFGGKDFLSLDKTKEEFFNDNVKYIIEHDILHEKVSYPHEPVYTRVLKEGKEVLIDNNKWELLAFEEKVKMLMEETTVIALERWILHNPAIDINKAHSYALKRMITNLTKNKFTEFIITNLRFFIKPDYKSINRILGINNMSLYEQIKKEVERSLPEYYDGFFGEVLLNSSFKNNVIEVLEVEGGGEGGAENCFTVFKYNNKCYKVEYRYYSYNGYEECDIANTLREVSPVEVKKIVYI